MRESKKIIKENFKEHFYTLKNTEKNLINKIEKIVIILKNQLEKKKLIMWCGNGGSASDSMHLSTELIGRYKKKRRALRSVSLSSDQATLTRIANDFGYENIFSRQIEGLGKKGDVLICLTTSGNSKNIINALKCAKKKKIISILISGNKGGKCKIQSNHNIIIPSKSTARIQEMQLLIGHSIIESIEDKIRIKNIS